MPTQWPKKEVKKAALKGKSKRLTKKRREEIADGLRMMFAGAIEKK
jgi:hypothetical protein